MKNPIVSRAVEALLKDRIAWEDPGYPVERLIGRFSRILRVYRYPNKSPHFYTRLTKRLMLFKTKTAVYNLMFTWANRLTEQGDVDEEG